MKTIDEELAALEDEAQIVAYASPGHSGTKTRRDYTTATLNTLPKLIAELRHLRAAIIVGGTCRLCLSVESNHDKACLLHPGRKLGSP